MAVRGCGDAKRKAQSKSLRGFLPGDPEDGIEELVFMPRSRHNRGEPAWDAIGLALTVMGEKLEGSPEREVDYQELIDRVTSRHPDYTKRFRNEFLYGMVD